MYLPGWDSSCVICFSLRHVFNMLCASIGLKIVLLPSALISMLVASKESTVLQKEIHHIVEDP